jgi:hypothetical protein
MIYGKSAMSRKSDSRIVVTSLNFAKSSSTVENTSANGNNSHPEKAF